MILTLEEVERLRARANESSEHVALEMDEETFRAFYERTARTLRLYLARVSSAAEADDLLQETYYRFLRARGTYASESHRRNALFAIATNVARDRHRRRRRDPIAAADGPVDAVAAGAPPGATAARVDVSRAMGRLKPRERGLLWLAYAQGWSHREIAAVLGLRIGSVKPLLFRARRRFSALLRGETGSEGAR
ncbi:MAG TPA: RNA polymerase sigma factor [Vicinamibacterales bacterium]|nr:RNA polymerase sigma factor [Vicinamibacterales bacterium]